LAPNTGVRVAVASVVERFRSVGILPESLHAVDLGKAPLQPAHLRTLVHCHMLEREGGGVVLVVYVMYM
jgi:hypothetical protein